MKPGPFKEVRHAGWLLGSHDMVCWSPEVLSLLNLLCDPGPIPSPLFWAIVALSINGGLGIPTWFASQACSQILLPFQVGEQDPYCIVKVDGQVVSVGGGEKPGMEAKEMGENSKDPLKREPLGDRLTPRMDSLA